MFCTKCGKELQAEDLFCTECGTPTEAESEVKEVTEVKEKKPLNKKVIIGIVAVLAVLFLVLLIPKGGKGGFKTPEEAFEANLNGFVTEDYDLMIQSYPDFRIESNGGEDKIKAETAITHDQQIEPYLAKGFTIKYVATGHTIADEAQRAEVEQDVNEVFGANAKLEELAFVTYELRMTDPSGKENSSPTTGMYATKYDGKWYYFNVK